MERMCVDVQVGSTQIEGQKGAVGLDEYGIGETSKTYPVSEPSGTCLTNVGLRAMNTSWIYSDEEDIHHCHRETIVGETLGCLAYEGFSDVDKGVR